jgi:LAS superfamily LD-carboxypeptidase LdcB
VSSTAPRAIVVIVLVLAMSRRTAAQVDTRSPTAVMPSNSESAPAPERLAWVNPARCLAVCAADPAAPLQRLDERAAPSPRGKYRVVAAVVAPLGALLAAAREAGFRLRLSSAFRSYKEQARLFRSIKERGRAARPGHSEHQLGSAIDLRLPSTKAIDWLAEHAFTHGFALSYPPGKQRLTGYRPEPWHIRFVGGALAAELHQRGWTIEQLFRARPELGESGSCGDCPAASSRTRCGTVTDIGDCQGTVLTWCYDGALAAVDCAASQQTCGRGDDGGPPDCRTVDAMTP